MSTYWPHHYMPACPCEQCQDTYRAALDREAGGLVSSGGECVGCRRIMSIRERNEQGVCDGCAEGSDR